MKFETLKKNNIWKWIGLLLIVSVIVFVVTFTVTRAKYQYSSKMEIVNGVVHYKTGDLSVLAVNIENSSGTYDSSDTVPTSGYALNTTESFCGTSNGDGTYTHDTSVTISYENGEVTIGKITKKGTKCFLYFDLDNVAPTISTFYIGGSSNPSTITSTSTTIYLTYSASDVAYYCISTTNSSSGCAWNATSSSPISVSYTLSGTGTKTLYAFLKDKAGNISSSKSDSVTVDTSPVISTFLINGETYAGLTEGDETVLTITWSSDYDIDYYCILKSSSDSSNCSWSATEGTSVTISLGACTSSPPIEYYAFIKSSAGFVSEGVSAAFSCVPSAPDTGDEEN